jgi:hypothetical protein
LDGSASGVVSAICCAFARSATSDADRASSATRSGALGLAGTVARFGYGALSFGGGGRSSAILPPSSECHQFTGFIAEWEEQPASSGAAMTAGHARAMA